jgi:DNA-binding PucR family transcriptional regulator
MAERRRDEEVPAVDAPGHGSDAEVEALRAEVERLTRVVDALMDRVEASTSVRGSDFGLFQTTIMLQDQVRLHTEELEAALGGPERDADQGQAAARDMQTLRRTAALQIQLLELVVQQKDLAELIERVAAILDMAIVLFDAHGRTVACSRTVAAADLAPRLWRAYAAASGNDDGAVVVTEVGERVIFRDVLVMGRTERVLAAATTRPRPGEIAGPSLLFLQQLVTLDLLRGRDELRMRRRLRRGLLHDVLGGDGAPEQLRIRLQEQGFDDESPLRIAVIEPAERVARGQRRARRAEKGNDLLAALDTVLSLRRLPYLTSSRGEAAVVLTALPDAEARTARALLAELLDAALGVSPGGAVAGCSAPLAGFGTAARGLQQARAACISARHADAAAGAALFEELSGHFRLLDALDEAELDDIVQRTFAPVLDYDARHRASLYQTLSTYFDHRLAVQETADALHIHRNTLQKRLANVEQLLGIDLGDLDAVVDVRLGLHAAELLGDPGA